MPRKTKPREIGLRQREPFTPCPRPHCGRPVFYAWSSYEKGPSTALMFNHRPNLNGTYRLDYEPNVATELKGQALAGARRKREPLYQPHSETCKHWME